jgi:hypothetical protein
VFELETNPDDLFSIKDSKQLVLAKNLAEYDGMGEFKINLFPST